MPWSFIESEPGQEFHVGAQLLSQEIIVLCIEFNVVFLNVLEQFICAKHFGDFDKLIVIIVTMEKGLFAEDHGSKHCS